MLLDRLRSVHKGDSTTEFIPASGGTSIDEVAQAVWNHCGSPGQLFDLVRDSGLRRSRDRIGHGSHKDFSSNRIIERPLPSPLRRLVCGCGILARA